MQPSRCIGGECKDVWNEWMSAVNTYVLHCQSPDAGSEGSHRQLLSSTADDDTVATTQAELQSHAWSLIQKGLVSSGLKGGVMKGSRQLQGQGAYVAALGCMRDEDSYCMSKSFDDAEYSR